MQFNEPEPMYATVTLGKALLVRVFVDKVEAADSFEVPTHKLTDGAILEVAREQFADALAEALGKYGMKLDDCEEDFYEVER